ncbi:hypothetical protein D049_1221B, partial [Vibrio parahaemolyticus VPTS-2010]
RRYLLP